MTARGLSSDARERRTQLDTQRRLGAVDGAMTTPVASAWRNATTLPVLIAFSLPSLPFVARYVAVRAAPASTLPTDVVLHVDIYRVAEDERTPGAFVARRSTGASVAIASTDTEADYILELDREKEIDRRAAAWFACVYTESGSCRVRGTEVTPPGMNSWVAPTGSGGQEIFERRDLARRPGGPSVVLLTRGGAQAYLDSVSGSYSLDPGTPPEADGADCCFTVETESQLLEAIAEAVYGSPESCAGRAIKLAADIDISATVDLTDARYAGLKIFSPCRKKISPTVAMHGSPLFLLGSSSDDIELSGFRVWGTAGRRFSAVVEGASSFANLSILDVPWDADALLDAPSVLVDGLVVQRSPRVGGSGGGIEGRLQDAIISGNRNKADVPVTLSASSTRVAVVQNGQLGDVVAGASSSKLAIQANVGVASIDTSASSGGNSVGGNSGCGTVTVHADDAVWGNT